MTDGLLESIGFSRYQGPEHRSLEPANSPAPHVRALVVSRRSYTAAATTAQRAGARAGAARWEAEANDLYVRITGRQPAEQAIQCGGRGRRPPGEAAWGLVVVSTAALLQTLVA